MTANLCVVCGSETSDGVVCVAETGRARLQLLGDAARDDMPGIVELAPAARAVYHRQTATGPTGSTHSAPGPRDPIDLQAGARLHAVQTALTGWVRAVREDAKVKSAPREGDLIAACAEWLAEPDHMEAIRHLEYAAELLREISDCWHAMRYVTSPRRERIYLGMCRAVLLVEGVEGPHTCEGSVYGAVGASRATCRVCGAKHDQETRITERAELAHSHTYTAAEIAAAYPGVVLAGTIRQWRRRGLLTVHGETGGHRLYQVSEVLALVESTRERQAGRRETAEMGA
jgi:hypothetical protein